MKHDFSLDVIRSIAIVLVIGVHCMERLSRVATIGEISINYLSYCLLESVIRMGVPLFVMLSGTLLIPKMTA